MTRTIVILSEAKYLRSEASQYIGRIKLRDSSPAAQNDTGRRLRMTHGEASERHTKKAQSDTPDTSK